MIKAVFFDLDGTLCDTLPDLTASLNYALRTFDLPVYGPDRVRDMIGNGISRLCSRALPAKRQDLHPQILALFRAHYAAHCTDQTSPFHGISETLSVLSDRGILLGVISNKPQLMAERVVAGCFEKVFFKDVLGQSERLPLKPDPALFTETMQRHGLLPSEVIYAGDSDTDLMFAGNAGVAAVGCSWGYRGRQFLADHGARNIIDSPKDLLGFVFSQEG